MHILIWLLACGTPEPASVQPPAEVAKVAEVAPAAPAAAAAAEEAAYTGRFAGAGYTAQELAGLSKSELRLLRNEIFARHGRAFASEDLQQHFSSQRWYEVREDFAESMLSDQDRDQSRLIQSFEQDNIDPSMTGEFHDGDTTLVFLDQQYVELLSAGEDLYEMERTMLAYEVHGRWVITWESESATAGQERTLWELNPDGQTVEQRLTMPPTQG